MAGGYVHLSLSERTLLEVQLRMGIRPSVIAAGLGRSRSTISREIRRNSFLRVLERRRPNCVGRGYRAEPADRRARQLRSRPRVERKLRPGLPLWNTVLAGVGSGLSPRQIAFTLARMDSPVHISHETIYTALYAMPRGDLRARVMQMLRHRRSGRRSRSKGMIGEARSRFVDPIRLIDRRPEEVGLRLVPGHWEGDLIKGRLNRSRVGTLVERTTLFTALVKLESGSAQATADGFAAILNRFDAAMRRSLTYDQGREMAKHRLVEQKAGIEVYFAHPHSPWERGINENTNGLLRQYLPKGEDLGRFSQQELDDIAFELNARPRQSLGRKAPAELFLPKGTFDFTQFWSAKLKHVALGV